MAWRLVSNLALSDDSAWRGEDYGRLNVLIGDEDPTGTFIFRTTGYNSIRTLTARMAYLSAASGGLLACLPLELKLRGKSTAQSYGRPVYFVDLVLRSGLTMEQALSQARELDAARKASGFDQTQLDEAAAEGFAKGVFEEGEDEGALVLEELFPSPVPLDAGQEQTYVVDFVNDSADILAAFKPYYETAELSGVTDPYLVTELKAKLDGQALYDTYEVDRVVNVALKGSKAKQSELDAALMPVASRLLQAFSKAKQDALAAGDDQQKAKDAKDRMDVCVRPSHLDAGRLSFRPLASSGTAADRPTPRPAG